MELSDVGYIVNTIGLSLQCDAYRRRADRAEASADDNYIAAAIHAGAARGHASVAGDLQVRLTGAEAEIERLRDIVEDLLHERSAILAASADLLEELDSLNAHVK